MLPAPIVDKECFKMGLKYKGKIVNDFDFVNKKYADWEGGKFTTMPTPTANLEGKVCQYIGITTTVAPIYTHGYLYECKEVTPSTTPKTYQWVSVKLQSGAAIYYQETAPTNAEVNDIWISTEVPPQTIVKYKGVVCNYGTYFYKILKNLSCDATGIWFTGTSTKWTWDQLGGRDPISTWLDYNYITRTNVTYEECDFCGYQKDSAVAWPTHDYKTQFSVSYVAGQFREAYVNDGTNWKKINEVKGDNSTIQKNAQGALELKNNGITVEKINTGVLNIKGADLSDDDLHLATSGKIKEYVAQNSAKVFKFVGYISASAPSGASKGELWYTGSSLPTSFPISVKVFDGLNWSTTTSYNSTNFDVWSLVAQESEWYRLGSTWNRIDASEVLVDELTIEKNSSTTKLQIPNGTETKGITVAKINTNSLNKTADDLSNDDNHIATSGLIKSITDKRVPQYKTMPTASLAYNGMVVQYIGATTSDYVSGYFYKCSAESYKLTIEPAGTIPAPPTILYAKNATSETSQLLYSDAECTAPSEFWSRTDSSNKYVYYGDPGTSMVIPSGTITNEVAPSAPLGWNNVLVQPSGGGGGEVLAVAIAPEYSSSSTYAIRSVVMHEGKRYKSNTAITTAEEWTPSHWDESSVESAKLNLTGGSMTGNITMIGAARMQKEDDSYGLTLFGAHDIQYGASLILYGADNTSYPGQFRLRSQTSGPYELVGEGNGKLTWAETYSIYARVLNAQTRGTLYNLITTSTSYPHKTMIATSVVFTEEESPNGRTDIKFEVEIHKIATGGSHYGYLIAKYYGEMYLCDIQGTNYGDWRKVASTTDLASYLPLSGGTITGTIYSDVKEALARSSNDQSIHIYGGTSNTTGASLQLMGAENSGSAGTFYIKANNGTNSAILEGRVANNTLLWGGKYGIVSSALTGQTRDTISHIASALNNGGTVVFTSVSFAAAESPNGNKDTTWEVEAHSNGSSSQNYAYIIAKHRLGFYMCYIDGTNYGSWQQFITSAYPTINTPTVIDSTVIINNQTRWWQVGKLVYVNLNCKIGTDGVANETDIYKNLPACNSNIQSYFPCYVNSTMGACYVTGSGTIRTNLKVSSSTGGLWLRGFVCYVAA